VRTIVAIQLLFIFTFAACSSENAPTPPQNTSTDAGFSTELDASGPIDSGPSDGGLPETVTSTYAELKIDEWRIGLLSGNTNPHAGDIQNGTFVYPEPGRDDRDVNWKSVRQADNGSWGDFQRKFGYAVARFYETEPRLLVVQPDLALRVYLNGQSQPGDPYGSGRMRVGLKTQVGENILVIYAYGARGNPKGKLWISPDEVFFNQRDRTFPDLRADDSSSYFMGIQVAFGADSNITDLVARVVESEHFQSSTVLYPHIHPGASTQIGFELRPKKAFATAGEEISIRLRLESFDLRHAYEFETQLTTTSTSAKYRKSFRSNVDHSIQYYGVVPPSDFSPDKKYGLVLSLHGASVEAIGQARAYSQKDWAYIVAPTNRRPFGFDWEEWGHLNGLRAFEDARATFKIDDTKTHVTGHSMGGHGTWHFGVHHAGMFATVNPSAGWNSFQTYGGSPAPSFPFDRARAHSTTNNYLSNLAQRGVFILHGGADNNVPVSEGRNMYAAARNVSQDVTYHEEPGKGHWWDGDNAPGVDCVDWTEMFDFMKARTIDPSELDFEFRSPGAHYSPTHSYVTLHSSISPMADLVLSSSRSGNSVRLATTNVRSMTLDGKMLAEKQISEVIVDDETFTVTGEDIAIGPTSGKTKDVHGPYNQVFHRPFCFVYYPHENNAFEKYVMNQISYWSIIGNGHACALPSSELTSSLANEYNLIHVGGDASVLAPFSSPILWNEDSVEIDSESYIQAAFFMVYPSGNRLSAVLSTTAGSEDLLYSLNPFSSRNGMPDFLVWSRNGLRAGGHFDGDWNYNAEYTYLRR